MTNTIQFIAIDDTGRYQQRRWVMPSVDTSFSVLNILVNQGWQLRAITLTDVQGHSIDLPTDAFDGAPMSWHLDQLQRQWQAVLGL
ncbi:hypothetical protein CLV58_1356 [Spirosoma oryzae]|uniref:Uncharacterized protein n=1 Tax=Spirosoma oryzae TaxID=1469603 RepID=A0A2T0S0P9_9BACT|nr:hypothetical protein [Spirosoma oryzae]PRY27004.1 hypothetical protein CLV58_1356 [Spirosoma oryzae]